MTDIPHIAVVNQSAKVSPGDHMSAVAAVQIQVTRDFFPAWGVNATVNPYGKVEDVPVGSLVVFMRDDIATPGAEGIHEDDNGNPMALVQCDDGWTLTLSHEILEMLGDPDGNTTIKAKSLKRGQGIVSFLKEASDPCEHPKYGYLINGVMVSDFVLLTYWTGSGKGKYSFTGAIKKPLTLGDGGYQSWEDGQGIWWQQQNFNGSKIVRLGPMTNDRSKRSQVNRHADYGRLLNFVPRTVKRELGHVEGLKRRVEEILAA